MGLVETLRFRDVLYIRGGTKNASSGSFMRPLLLEMKERYVETLKDETCVAEETVCILRHWVLPTVN